jgi:hypothetical protein
LTLFNLPKVSRGSNEKHLDEESIWQIFNLDIEFGKYEVQKK